jgi:nucleoside-diphosphate-sugar epimerase
MKSDWEYTHRINVEGVDNLINIALAENIERLIYLSDIEVYDLNKARQGSVIDEEWPRQSDVRQMGAYIHSRIQAEDLIFAACRDRNLSAVILRAGMVIGPLGQIFFPQLGYQYKQQYFFVLRKGTNTLPLTYIGNMVDAMIQASMNENAIGQVYNLVDDAEISVIDYIEKFIGATQSSARIIPTPYFLPYLATCAYEVASRIGLVKQANTSRSRFKWKHAPVVFGNGKVKEQLGWRPAISLQDGINSTIDWYVSQQNDTAS